LLAEKMLYSRPESEKHGQYYLQLPRIGGGRLKKKTWILADKLPIQPIRRKK
jgi:hypothetical protein